MALRSNCLVMVMADPSTSGDTSLAALVRRWRRRALLTQEELAERAGISVRTIRRLESTGGVRPRGGSVRRLAAALGLNNGERAQLASALRSDVTSPPAKEECPAVVPHQLPAGTAGFVGRQAQLRELDGLLASGTSLAVIVGTAGVGKTTLAVHWANLVADQFPHGQLYVNLRGYDPGGAPVDPGVAVRGFLEALGVPSRHLLADLDSLTALYRSVLAGRRTLVVLDNARDTDQIRPLLPGAAGCFTLVTSRDQLTGLVVTDTARLLTLEPMSEAEARSLLARRVGPRRVAAELEAVGSIIGLCARLPLALAVASARAASRPDRSLAALADELGEAGDRLDVLDVGDPLVSVRQVLSWSYQRLSMPAVTMFRMLGLHPGPDIGLPAAASLAGRSIADTRLVLTELTRAHLLTESARGRFWLHDLLRAYAAELAQSLDPERERRAAVHRMVDHYLHSSLAAAALLDPQRDLHPPARGPVVTNPERPSNHSQALAWLTTEYPILSACVAMAAGAGLHAQAWHLAWALPPFLDRRGHWQDWATTQTTALAAAERLGDLPKQARSHRSLGGAYTQLGRWGEADHHLRRALEIYRDLHDRPGQAHTHLDIDWLLDRQSRHRDALGQAEIALELFRTAGDRAGEARASNNVGWHHMQIGAFARGLDYCRRARDWYHENRNLWGEANALDSLGYAHHHLGEYREAIDCYRHAVRLSRAAGDRPSEAEALSHLGDTYHAVGDLASARAAWEAALDVLDALGHPDADHLRAKLTSTAG